MIFQYLLKSLKIRRVHIGYEHRSQDLLNIVKFGLTQKQQDEATDFLIEAGIHIDAGFILGVPGETEETLKEVYEFVKSLKKKSETIIPRPGILILIPPSILWQEALKNSDFNNRFGDTDIMNISDLNNAAIDMFYTGDNGHDKVYETLQQINYLK